MWYHKNRKAKGNSSMLNVVFSDSQKGSLLQAQLGDVVQIGFYLDIGDIRKGMDSNERQKVFDKIWGDENFQACEKEQFFAMQRADHEKLMMAVHKSEPIRIWISDEPSILCGFYYVCHMLSFYPCDIHTIALPNFWWTKSQMLVSYSGWEEIRPSEWKDFLVLEKPMVDLEISFFAQQWEKLKQENAPLRANINGILQSVPLDFYDVFIKRNIPDQEFPMAWLIGTVMGKEQLRISYGFIKHRIQTMIEDGKLILVEGNQKDSYTSILRSIE